MLRDKVTTVPVLDQELFILLGKHLCRSEYQTPSAQVFEERILPREILFHRDSYPKWFLARVNYSGKVIGVVNYIGNSNNSKATFYDSGQMICSVAGLETPGGIHLMTLELSDQSRQEITAHLGALALLTDRDEL